MLALSPLVYACNANDAVSLHSLVLLQQSSSYGILGLPLKGPCWNTLVWCSFVVPRRYANTTTSGEYHANMARPCLDGSLVDNHHLHHAPTGPTQCLVQTRQHYCYYAPPPSSSSIPMGGVVGIAIAGVVVVVALVVASIQMPRARTKLARQQAAAHTRGRRRANDGPKKATCLGATCLYVKNQDDFDSSFLFLSSSLSAQPPHNLN